MCPGWQKFACGIMYQPNTMYISEYRKYKCITHKVYCIDAVTSNFCIPISWYKTENGPRLIETGPVRFSFFPYWKMDPSSCRIWPPSTLKFWPLGSYSTMEYGSWVHISRGPFSVWHQAIQSSYSKEIVKKKFWELGEDWLSTGNHITGIYFFSLDYARQ